jgi:hypothetical protein
VGPLVSLLIAAALLAPPAPAPAASASPSPVRVSATAAKAEVTLGEPFTVTLAAEGPSGASYTFPGEAASEALELRSLPDAPGAAPLAPGKHRYEATVFALGEAQLPAIPVRYRLADGTSGEAASAPLTLRVVSLLSKDPKQQKLVDVRGPLDVSIGRAFWITLGLALAALGALVYWVVRRRRRGAAPAVARPEPPVPPDVEALAALDALVRSGLVERGEQRAFYIRLTAVAKRYLERRLGAPILEMTSAETLAFLRGHAHGGDLLPVVRDVAEAADRVKFARGAALAAEAERHLAAVRALVPALEARLRPPEPAPEGRAA